MVKLVAISFPPGQTFVDAIERVWSDGNAFCVLDPRLPKQDANLAIQSLGVDTVLGEDGFTTLPNDVRSLQPLDEGDALVMATSGSTGEPKAVIHTHASIAASASATSKAIDANASSDKWLACLPLSHIGGLSVVLRALHTNTPLELHEGFDAKAVELAARGGATLVSLVTRALTQIDPTLFRTILIGGAAPPKQRPANVVATYGMTETGSGIVYDQATIDGAEIDFDTNGQILVRGPMLFRRYRRGPTPIDQDGWFQTGDFGGLGDAGELVVDGRGSDVIVSGGENVWPSRLEAVLRTSPDISNAMALGEPHPEWGQQVIAHIVTPGVAPTLEAVRDLVKRSLPAWYAPKKIVIVKELPKTATGKSVKPFH